MIHRIHAMMRWLAPILIMFSGGCSSSDTRQPESMISDAASPVDMAVMPVDMAVGDDMARMVLVCDLDCTGHPAGSNCMLQQLLCAAMPDLMSTD